MPSSWTKCGTSGPFVCRCAACITDRKESTITMAGEVASTSWTMRFSTASSPPSRASFDRLMNRTDAFTFARSKNSNCC